MVKKLTAAELAELKRIGSVEYDPETHNIARFGELIDKLNELISLRATETQADLARSQVQLEVLATMQKTMRENSRGSTPKVSPVDFSPLVAILAELQENRMVAWEFDIQRNGPGEHSPMAKVIATPIEPTRH
jgi:hypothetical protein